MAKWWNPFSWGNAVQDAVEAFQGIIHGWLVGATSNALDEMMNLFNSSVSALKTEVALTPAQFNVDLVETLRSISTNIILPVAGIIVTYVFVLEIIEQTTKMNKGQEWDGFDLMMLIFKTSITIALTTHAFTIGLAFSDVSTWMIGKVPTSDVEMTVDLKDDLLESVAPYVEEYDEDTGTWGERTDLSEPDEDNENQRWNYRLGELSVLMVFSVLGMIFAFVIGAIMYLTAWSRLIMILLYVTVAPLPMATLMSETWVNTVGQNYLRNLLALTLQGFFMLVLLIIYQGLITRTIKLLADGSGGYTGLMLVIVSMATITKLLIGTGTFSKSITGAT